MLRPLLAGVVGLWILAPVAAGSAFPSGEECAAESGCSEGGADVPSAPRNVVVNAADVTSVTLEWNPPASSGAGPVTSYVVRWGAMGVRTTPTTSIRVDGLSPKTQYLFIVAAVNRDGESIGVGVAARTRPVPTKPSAPLELTASDIGTTSLTLSWRRPADDGGSDVVGYLVTWADEELYVTDTGLRVKGLAAATSYRITVRARSAVGLSDPVETVVTTLFDPVPTPTPPTVPRNLAVVRQGHTFLNVQWSEPRSDGGSAITAYLLRWGGERLVVDADTRSARIDGLAPGVEYLLTLVATNMMGDSVPAETSAYTAMDPVPAPQSPSAPREPRIAWTTTSEIALAWSPPADDGGLPVDGYQVTDDAGRSTSSTSPFLVMGGYLAGTQHTFRIRAINGVGWSPPLELSAFTSMDPVPGPSVPTQPRALTAYSVTADAIALAWRAPLDDGRSRIAGYEVSWGGQTRLFVQRESAVLVGLTPGTGYEISVRALNDSGAGEPAQTTIRTRLVPVPAPQAPTEPERLRVVESTRTSLLVDWLPPRSDGGSTITGYRVQVSGSTPFVTAESGVTIVGLAPGTEYRVTVAALNRMGSSADAMLRAYTGMEPVPAPQPPTEPVDVRATWTTTSAVALAWIPPTDDGGSPVVGYEVADDRGRVVTSDVPFAVMDGFAPASRHVFRVRARNAIGLSEPATVFATTVLDPIPAPRVPGEPRALRTYLVSSSTVALAWRAPVQAASRPIDGYLVTWGQDLQAFVSQPSVVVDDLQSGTAYTFRVRAVNYRGPGPEASIDARTKMVPVPVPEAPSAPRDMRVTGLSNSSIALQWQPPARDGGRSINGYRVQIAGGTAFVAMATTALMTGLEADREYTIEVRALNDAGESPVSRLRARTTPAHAPAPVPGPPPTPVTPAGAGSNADGSVDLDGRSDSVRQVVPGRWPARTWTTSGNPVRVMRLTGLLTNAGQIASIRVTYRSPSIVSARIRRDAGTGWFLLTAILKRGASSGGVILTIGAPQVTRDSVTYEPLQSSQRFTVLPAPRR